MGLACGTMCSRERSGDNNPDDPEFAQQVFFEYLDHTRSQGSVHSEKTFVPVTKFDNIVTSAANYWTNRQKFNINGNRRPVVTYNIDSRNQLIKIHNSVFTKQELQAVTRIQRWWLKILARRKQRQNRSHTSQPTQPKKKR